TRMFQQRGSPSRTLSRRALRRGEPDPARDRSEYDDPQDEEIDPDLVVSPYALAGGEAAGSAETLDDLDAAAAPDGAGLSAPWAPTREGKGTPMPEIPPGEPVVLIDCHLNYGFVLTEIGLAIITEREIFGEEIRQTAPKRRKGAAFISDFRDLKPGDLVVHVDHGVARYLGLARPPGS